MIIFIFEQVGYINDDHKYVNEIINIPTIDIIHLTPRILKTAAFLSTGIQLETISMLLINKHWKLLGKRCLTVIYEEK